MRLIKHIKSYSTLSLFWTGCFSCCLIIFVSDFPLAGPESTSMFKSRFLCIRFWYKYHEEAGYFHTFKVPKVRAFNNSIIEIKTTEDEKGSHQGIRDINKYVHHDGLELWKVSDFVFYSSVLKRLCVCSCNTKIPNLFCVSLQPDLRQGFSIMLAHKSEIFQFLTKTIEMNNSDLT